MAGLLSPTVREAYVRELTLDRMRASSTVPRSTRVPRPRPARAVPLRRRAEAEARA